ncbi:hypothetical protein KBI52_10355 [Microvirga sp. HBU67558]|uniref:hypothetical protein n=1 Tax=Microvirga TaxID=186650 RepID=UPI001B369C8A|nr:MULTISPECIES: hypothetical protein [unclassified Microvirga]MBQ0820605.1 hypothetical protein [Microvirga sp. HBU67558]
MRNESQNPEPTGASAVAGEPGPSMLVLFHRDERGKGHAGSFGSADAELALKAAALMGVKILRLTADQQQALPGKLPTGKIFSSSQKALLPFCNRLLIEQLEAMGGEIPAQGPEAIQPALNQAPMPDAEVSSSGDTATPTTNPSSWDAITVGSVVLASEGHMDGWYEAVVTDAKPNDLFILRWRDWPDLPTFVRKRGHLSLLPPFEAAAAPK